MIAARLLALALALGALAGCSAGSGGIRRELGLEAPPPDPFLTVARAPLTVPADLTALPAPRPGAPSLVDPDPRRQAEAALLGTPAPAPSSAPTQGEAALLAAAGASQADPAIRASLQAEASQTSERRYGLDSLLGVPIDQDTGDQLEAEAEAERLRAQGLLTPTPPPAPPETP